jgi:two-component system chemotaxis sensor kinase CheA
MSKEDDLNKRLIEIFAQESRDFVSDLDDSLRFLDPEQAPEMLIPIVGEIFRVVHSLKASVATLGYAHARDYLHVLENVLDRIREGDLEVNEAIVDLLFSATGRIKGDLDYLIAEEEDLVEPITGDVVDTLKSYANADVIGESQGKTPVSPEKTSYYQIIFRPDAELLESGTDPIMLISELSVLGEVVNISCGTERIPSYKDFEYFKCYLSWEIILRSNKAIDSIEDVFMFVKNNSDVRIEDVTGRYDEEGKEKLLENKKIGEILVERGQASEEDIEDANEKQEKIGEILVQENKVAPEVLNKALQDQQQVKKAAPTTIRVDILKLDILVNLIGELVISESRLRNLAESHHRPSEMRNIITQCDDMVRIIKELQEQAMNIRMIPVDTIFTQFHRLVRDLSKQQGKVIRLALTGQETELDKNIIEKINNPLKHIVRNSIDHGIEALEERQQTGKATEALIQLKAYQKEGAIYIEVTDDGRGLDKEKIYHKALEKGLIDPNVEVSDDEIYNMVFNPGFSTADKITDISGRGVGMDVVKRAIHDLRGDIFIKTEKGQGTSFIIRLPLTLAVIEGLLFKISDQVMIIPLASVDEVMSIRDNDIKTIEKQGEYINVRGQPHTLVRMNKLFGLRETKAQEHGMHVLLNVNVDGKKFSLLIDSIVGQQQVVLKSLEDNFKKTDGFLGSTILGDGSIAAIIDPNEIVELFKTRSSVKNFSGPVPGPSI